MELEEINIKPDREFMRQLIKPFCASTQHPFRFRYTSGLAYINKLVNSWSKDLMILFLQRQINIHHRNFSFLPHYEKQFVLITCIAKAFSGKEFQHCAHFFFTVFYIFQPP